MTGPIQFEQPLPATFEQSNTPCLVHGVVGDDALLQFDDGRIKWFPLDAITIDFRFDYRRGAWINTSFIGGDDVDDEEDDRGQGIQGALSDIDGVGDSDQGDEADYGLGDVDAIEAEP